MAKELTYAQQRDRKNLEAIRTFLLKLPECCTYFIRSIEETSTSLTRLAYVRDLRLFFRYLVDEVPYFGGKEIFALTDQDIAQITGNQIALYSQYLSLYLNDQERELSNGELAKMRKLASLRSFFQFMFKQGKIPANVAQLIDLPKIHDKPILRLEIDEVARMLDVVQSGDALSTHQKVWHERTKVRDLAMISLFLGTGIRVSECVGINMDDVDFEMNAFLVTRKGGNQTLLYFPDEVAEELKKYMVQRKEMNPLPGHEQALFLSTQNKRISVRSVENMVKKYALIAAPLKKSLRRIPHCIKVGSGKNTADALPGEHRQKPQALIKRGAAVVYVW